MNREEIDGLLARFRAGKATDAEKAALEKLLEEGVIQLDDIEDLSALYTQAIKLELPEPSPSLDHRFYNMLEAQHKPMRTKLSMFPSWQQLIPKLAFASIMLFVGLAAGLYLRPPSPPASEKQISMLHKQLSDLQEMMMLSLLEKESVTERLRAVNLTLQMDEASKKVTAALIQTLNEDENVNVRLAALEALKPYVRDSSVREALVRSIALQESPLVQISLAELMVALREKAAVSEFEKIIGSDNTPAEIKEKIRASIEVLI